MSAIELSGRPNGLFHRIPVVGSLARAVDQDTNLVFYILVILVTAMVFAIKVWGIAALVLTYIALVPFIFALFIWITLP